MAASSDHSRAPLGIARMLLLASLAAGALLAYIWAAGPSDRCAESGNLVVMDGRCKPGS